MSSGFHVSRVLKMLYVQTSVDLYVVDGVVINLLTFYVLWGPHEESVEEVMCLGPCEESVEEVLCLHLSILCVLDVVVIDPLKFSHIRVEGRRVLKFSKLLSWLG